MEMWSNGLGGKKHLSYVEHDAKVSLQASFQLPRSTCQAVNLRHAQLRNTSGSTVVLYFLCGDGQIQNGVL